MSDYDDSDAAIDSDGDDDVAELVGKKRKFAYTTFGNEADSKYSNSKPQVSGKDAATYGVFMDSGDDDDRYTKRRIHNPSAAPMFVSSTRTADSLLQPQAGQEKKEHVNGDAQEAETNPKTTEEQDDAENDKKERKIREQQQQAANARFEALLVQARGKRHHRSSSSRLESESAVRREEKNTNNKPDEFFTDAAPPAGIGFSAAAESTRNNDNDSDHAPHIGVGDSVGISQFASASFSGLGFEQSKPRIDPNLGKWEKHTKGIGMKLLSKMGYKGSGGLGAKRLKKQVSGEIVQETKSKGISRPVEVVVRPNSLGLGFGNFKEASKLKGNRQIEAEVRGLELPSDKRPESESTATIGRNNSSSSALPSTNELLAQQSWRKGARQASSRKRPRRTVVPYTEILANEENKPVVIDMRGPAASLAPSTDQQQGVQLAEELLHNVTLLLNTHENKLRSTAHFVRSSERKLQSLNTDMNDMKRREREGQERIDKLHKVLKIMDQIQDLLNQGDMSNVGEAANAVQALVRELGATFTVEERSALKFYKVLAPSLLGPIVQARLQKWDPLTDESAASAHLLQFVLKLFGGDSNDEEEEGALSMRRSMFLTHVLPRVKRSFESSKWNPMQNIDQALEVYEAVLGASEVASQPKHNKGEEKDNDQQVFQIKDDDEFTDLVDLVQEEIGHDAIYQKLSRAIHQWKPEIDEDERHLMNRMDLWILPWLQYLDRRSTIPTLLSDVKKKLRSALSFLKRCISDDALFLEVCVETLKPWRNVLKKETLHDLTSTFVTPRLAKYLSGMNLNRDSKSENWTDLDLPSRLNGMGLLSDREFLSIVEGEILYNWVDVLHTWLSSGEDIDKSKVATNYFEWKSRLFHCQNEASKPPSAATDRPPWMLLRDDAMICRFFGGSLMMIQADVKSDPGALEVLRPMKSSYKVVVARRAKEERIKAEEAMRKMEYNAVGNNNGIGFSYASEKKGESSTFREVVENFARERDLPFLPRQGENSTKDGKQIFLLGKLPIYLDSNVVFTLKGAKWGPISLEQLESMFG